MEQDKQIRVICNRVLSSNKTLDAVIQELLDQEIVVSRAKQDVNDHEGSEPHQYALARALNDLIAIAMQNRETARIVFVSIFAGQAIAKKFIQLEFVQANEGQNAN